MLKNLFLFSLVLFLLNSCVPGFDKEFVGLEIDFNKESIKHVLRLQDEQNVDSLELLLNNEDPNIAYLASRAFASCGDEKNIDSLSQYLQSKHYELRAISAYALGQIKNPNAEESLVNAFRNKDTLDINNEVNSKILEAVGKCGGEKMLLALSTISTYRNTDTLLLLGQARGIYRYATRGMTSPAGTKRMVEMVTDNTYPYEVRLIASHYLSRAKNININDYKFSLVKYFTSDASPNIRMALAGAFAKVSDNEIHSYLLNQLDIEKDYRVKVNIIRALGNYPYIKSVDAVMKLINDENLHIAQEAGAFLIENGTPQDATFYRSMINDTLHYSVNAKLYAAVLKNIPHYFVNTRKQIKKEILEKVESEISLYEKVALVSALGHEPNAYIELNEIAEGTEDKALSTACYEAIGSLLVSPHFTKTHKSRHLFKRKEIADLILKIIQKGDSGIIAVAADMIIDPETQLKDIIAELSFLIEARNNLNLPRETETYNKLQQAISLIKGEPFVELPPKFNNPMEWSYLDNISDTTLAVIKTSKGNISFTPFVNDAPGSVINFLKLAQADFYDNKTFHRVVPNFVIQGGCPRGDGYGSLDYTIRSEFSPLYYDDEGYIGMASAGPHTEGTQFFITHSPTPHLDGRYTIFGKVKSGMDVVHNIFPGDKILDVIISK